MNHVDHFFIHGYYKAINVLYKEVNKSKDISYQKLVDEDFFNYLVTYFSEKARCNKNDALPLLSLKSDNGYFSATKIHSIQVYENKKAEDLPCFAPRKWKRNVNVL